MKNTFDGHPILWHILEIVSTGRKIFKRYVYYILKIFFIIIKGSN